MKKLAHYCLAHPCWSGVSGIVAIVALLGTAKWPWNLSTMIQPANGKESPIFSLLPEFGSPRTNPKSRELPDLSGKWVVSTEVATSTYTAYHGLVLYYEVGVSQAANII